MKKLLLLLMFLTFSINTQAIDYKSKKKEVKMLIKNKRSELKATKHCLKLSPNDVDLHKALVKEKVDIIFLKNKLKDTKNAEKLHKKLIKENNKFDKKKIELLELKEQSIEADKKLI